MRGPFDRPLRILGWAGTCITSTIFLLNRPRALKPTIEQKKKLVPRRESSFQARTVRVVSVPLLNEPKSKVVKFKSKKFRPKNRCCRQPQHKAPRSHRLGTPSECCVGGDPAATPLSHLPSPAPIAIAGLPSGLGESALDLLTCDGSFFRHFRQMGFPGKPPHRTTIIYCRRCNAAMLATQTLDPHIMPCNQRGHCFDVQIWVVKIKG